ncbi:MAG: 3-isopropylmalate dehydrogenase, partial [Chloroflexi bacterium]|nr:3-isopropylmalate dehydrogenase [Chloroflexota bacterium]
PKEALAVEQAVDVALELGLRTADILAPGERAVTTTQMGNAIAEAVARG